MTAADPAEPPPAPAMPWRQLAWPLALALLAHAWLLESLPRGSGDDAVRGGVPALQTRRIELPPPPPPAVEPTAPAPRPTRTAAAPTAAPRKPAPPRPPAAEPEVAALPAPAAAAPTPATEPGAAEPAAAVADAASAAEGLAVAPDAAASAAAPGAAPPAGGVALPTYPTRIPPSATLAYDIRRGALSGSGALHWRAEGERYELSLEGAVLGMAVIEQVSQGGFDGAGLAPRRFADRRRGRDVRAANFQREAGKISFSGVTTEYPLVPGAQDRLSWMVQLAAIVAALPAEELAAGRRVQMFVAGSRGDGDVWTFVVQSPGADTPGLHLLRLPRRDVDTRIEVWLDPARGGWPVRAVQTTPRSGESTEMLLVDGPGPLQR